MALSTSDSPYAAELHAGGGERPFGQPLEAEYIRSFLRSNRMLIRMASVLGLLIILFRVGENLIGGSVLPLQVWTSIAGLAVGTSAVLTWLAWSPAFERRYSPIARLLVPARNVVAAVPVAATAAHGHLELLMILPAMVLGPFFFLGLQYRAALVCVVLTVTAFIASASVFELSTPVLVRAGAFLLLTAVACAIAARQLERSSRKSFLEGRLIAEFAQHDALTGTKNRRVFDEHLARLWRQALDDGRNFVIALADVDHFKAYNDRYGHQAGDETLRRVAQTLQKFVSRPLDILARYGGEEFAVVLYDVESSEAADIAERMRLAVSKLAIEHRGSKTAAMVTISIGVAVITPSDRRHIQGALQLADETLYKAKVGGRNRVELVGQAEYGELETGVFAAAALKTAKIIPHPALGPSAPRGQRRT